MVKIQLRRDIAANWTSVNPVLSLGEPGYETDTQLMKYGDGATAWTSLPYHGPALSGIAGGVLNGTYPNPGFAVNMATQAELDTAVAPLAPLASPALTGNPTAPTAAAGDNDTSLATTAWVTRHLPIFNVKEYGAVGDATTDDTTAIQAAITAAQASGGAVWFVPFATYALSGALTITGKCTVMGNGATLLRKAGNTGNANLVTIQATAQGVQVRDLTVDGGLVNVTGFATLILWLGPDGVAENVTAQNAKGTSTGNGWAIGPAATNFYGTNVRARWVTSTGLGFYIAAVTNATFEDVYVEDCSYAGFYVPEAATRLTVSGASYRNGITGLYLLAVNEVHVKSWESIEDNGFGAQIDGRPGSNAGIFRVQIDQFTAIRTGAAFTSPTTGAVAANGAGTGLEAYYMHDSIIGNITSVDALGYGVALVACLRNTFANVAAHGMTSADGDPPVTLFASSSYNHFASIRSTGGGSTWALIIGEDTTDCAHNTVDVVSSYGCPFGCVIITGSYNHIGRIVSRDTFVYNNHTTIPCDSVVFFSSATAHHNTIGFVDHKNTASPGASHTTPDYLVHSVASAADNKVLGAFYRDVTIGPLADSTGALRTTVVLA